MRIIIMIGVCIYAYSYFTSTPINELVDKDDVVGFASDIVETVKEASQ